MFLVRYGEIFLKSEPVRKRFASQLVSNIRAKLPGAKIHAEYDRIIVQPKSEKEAASALKKTFGIVSFSPALMCNSKIDEIEKAALKLKPKTNQSFAVRANRAWKAFPLTSKQIEQKIGSLIQKNVDAPVNLTKPSHTIHIDVRHRHSFIFSKIIPGPGGLPVGTAGKIFCKPPNLVASAFLLAKRGCTPVFASEKGIAKLKPYLPKIETGKPFAPYSTGETNPEKIPADPNLLAPLVGFGKTNLNSLLRKI